MQARSRRVELHIGDARPARPKVDCSQRNIGSRHCEAGIEAKPDQVEIIGQHGSIARGSRQQAGLCHRGIGTAATNHLAIIQPRVAGHCRKGMG